MAGFVFQPFSVRDIISTIDAFENLFEFLRGKEFLAQQAHKRRQSVDIQLIHHLMGPSSNSGACVQGAVPGLVIVNRK